MPYSFIEKVGVKLTINSMKERIIYLVILIITMFLGLASRAFASYLPDFLAENAGDALWAMMIYFGCRFLFPKKSPYFALIGSILFSFGIELSQIYQAEWIQAIRQTTIGALILGKGFLVIDLIRYVFGILLGHLLDRVFHKKKVIV